MNFIPPRFIWGQTGQTSIETCCPNTRSIPRTNKSIVPRPNYFLTRTTQKTIVELVLCIRIWLRFENNKAFFFNRSARFSFTSFDWSGRSAARRKLADSFFSLSPPESNRFFVLYYIIYGGNMAMNTGHKYDWLPSNYIS